MRNRYYSFLLIPAIVMALIAFVKPVYAGFKGYLQQGSGVTVCVGPFIQMASANTPYTTYIPGTLAMISKNGGAIAAKNDAGHLSPSGSSGFMLMSLNGTDTATPGILTLIVHHSQTLLVEHAYQVVSPQIYAAFYSSGDSDYLHTDVIQFSGNTTPATNGKPDVQNVHSGVSFASTAVIAGGVTLHTTAILPSGATLAANQDVRNVLGVAASGITLHTTAIVPSGVTVTGLTASALADLFDTNSGTNYAGAVAGSVVKEIADNAGGSALTELGIASAVTQALGDSGVTVHHNETVALAEFFSVDAGAYAASNVGSVVKEIADNAGGSALSEAGIATAVNKSIGESGVSISQSGVSNVIVGSGVTVTDKTGFALAPNQDVRNVTAIVGGGVTLSATAILPSGATLAANSITAAVIATDAIDADALAADAATEITTAVWAATTKDVRNLTGAISSGATLAANQDVRNATGIVGSGVTVSDKTGFSLSATADVRNVTGIIVGGVTDVRNVTGVISSGATLAANSITAAVIATDAIDADAIAANAITSSELADNAITAAKIATDAITSDELAESGVSEIAYHIWGKKISEPAVGAPTANPELQAVLRYLYFSWRNKAETVSSGVSTYADDGSTIIYKFLHSDDGSTYTKGEVVTP